MGRRLVVQPDNKLASFSGVLDDFMDWGMTDEQAVKSLRDAGFTQMGAEQELQRARGESTRFEEALAHVTWMHGRAAAARRRAQMAPDEPTRKRDRRKQ